MTEETATEPRMASTPTISLPANCDGARQSYAGLLVDDETADLSGQLAGTLLVVTHEPVPVSAELAQHARDCLGEILDVEGVN